MTRKKRIVLGHGKLIRGMGAYAIAPLDWEPTPGNMWEDAGLKTGKLVFEEMK